MQSRILASIDRTLTWRARANAASAVRADVRHAVERDQAAEALVDQVVRRERRRR